MVCVNSLPMSTVRTAQWFERQSSKRQVVGSSPAVGKNFSFCNFRFLCVAHSSNKSLPMKSTVTYTGPIPYIS